MKAFTPSHSLSLPVFILATAVYLLTMSRTVDWWDCGEFIATSYLLQVGHPPGAPFYQLLAHCMTMLSFGHPLWVAPLSNALSALCGGLTVMLLYLTLCELTLNSKFKTQNSKFPIGPAVGALCYLFCDTAWFSAVESEVYAMAMLFCSLDVWLMLCWRRTGNPRLLLLVALLLGLGVCVHLMTLLTLPALLWLFLRGKKTSIFNFQFSILFTFFILLGLTPYAIVPIRAAANPPINQLGDSFAAYIKRDAYAHAPLYPRLWRERDSANWQQWGVGNPASLWDNTRYYASYQLSYMYLRYLSNNFIARENMAYNPDRKNFSIFNFQFSIFILPFLLGLWGMWVQWRRRRGDFIPVLLLFLFGGIILNLYLNHPCYEPRERDYAYVLSFYAFALWIGIGAGSIAHRRWRWAMLLAPALLALGNWPDHDRSRSHAVHDIALNHLQSCDPDAILITYGDNDTFPLWYLQQVEGRRTDIEIHNVNLEGYYAIRTLLADNAFRRPVYVTQYTLDALGPYLPGHPRCEGFCHRLLPTADAAGDPAPLRRHLADSIRWHITPTEYLDPVSRSFLATAEKIFSPGRK
ncbi:MAG: DUF2723 domain-containing protein [Bacteroidales bacterium]|nr:DUF2723 domain-containing protein [Bacteroidales bacterium]